MSNTFYIKQNDTSPKLVYTLDTEINLAGATAVFNLRPITARGASPIERASATIEDTKGVLGYAFAAAQTSVAGVYHGEFEVTYGDSTIETFPNTGYITVKVHADLG